MSTTIPARFWTDAYGDQLKIRQGNPCGARVEVSDVVALTSAQCREVAAYLTALADARDPQETTMPETTPAEITVWPAPAPPAVEVELETKHPAHLTNVTDVDRDTCAYMSLDRQGNWRGVDQDGNVHAWHPAGIISATHPVHGPIRRDGDRPDCEPRFVTVTDAEADQ